jgi:phosphoribosyl 1,2-cyclic phosphodiesterase
MLVIDCQYTDDEYPSRRGWGHNSVATVVDLCLQARPDALVLFHHDPENNDEQVAALADDASARLERAGVTETLVLPARERLTMKVCKPLHPLALPC